MQGVRDEQWDHYLNRNRESEDQVVPERAQEERVVEEETEVVEADPLGRGDAVPTGERVIGDAPEGIGDEDRDEGDGRQRVEESPQPLWAAGTPARERYSWSGQGLSVFLPLSTFAIACWGEVLPENAAWSWT